MAERPTGNADLGSRSGERALGAAGLILVFLLGLGTFLRPDPDFDVLFAVDIWRPLGAVPFLTGVAVLLVVLFVPGVSDLVARGVAATVRRIPGPMRIPLLLVGSAAAFLLLTNHRLSGDATVILPRVAVRHVFPSNALTDYLFNLAADLFSLDPPGAIRAVSCAAGLVYVAGTIAVSRSAFPDTPRRVAVGALLLTAGPVALFFGTLEVYATLAAGIVVYLALGLRTLAGRGGCVAPALCLGITFCLHGAAGFLLPSLVFLANGGRLWPIRFRRNLASAAVFLLPIVLVFSFLYFSTWGGEPPGEGPYRYGSFGGPVGQGPVLPLVADDAFPTYRYALLDAEHLLGVLGLWLFATPAGFLLALLGRRVARSARRRFVLLAAAFLAVFPVFWVVTFAYRRDWDLFSALGVPLALLGGLAFLRAGLRPATVVKVAALSLFAFLPFILANHGDRLDRHAYARAVADALADGEMMVTGDRKAEIAASRRDWKARAAAWEPEGAAKAFATGVTHAYAGNFAAAAAAFETAHGLDPRNVPILVEWARVLDHLDRGEEAEEVLLRAVLADPENLTPRIALADLAMRRGDREAAIDHLRKGLRAASIDLRMEEARAYFDRLRK